MTGVKLSQLTDAQKNDLARLVATRGVVFFRKQEALDIEPQRKLGNYFATIPRHATTSMLHKEELGDVHVIYTTEQSLDQRAIHPDVFVASKRE